MGLKEWIAVFKGDHRLVEVAEQIANQCLDSVWPQIQPRVEAMQLAELRGYVRARTRGAVNRHVAQSSQTQGLAADRLVAAVLDEVTRMAVARALAPAPAVAAPMRRAA